MVKRLKILFLLQFFNFCFSSIEISSIEREVFKMTKFLIESEVKVAKSLQNCDSHLKFGVANLKASNLSENITKPLENMRIPIQEMSKLEIHENAENLTNWATCEYLTVRSSFIELEIRKQDGISKDLQRNMTKLLELRKKIVELYEKNVKVLRNVLSKEKFLTRIWGQFGATAKDLMNFWRFLRHNKKYLNNFLAFLGSLESNLTCTVVNSTFKVRGEQIEDKFKTYEDQLACK